MLKIGIKKINWQRSLILTLALSVFGVTVVFAQSPAQDQFTNLANDYIDHYYFPAWPTLATQLGEHQYDNQLEDYSRAGVNQHIKQLKQFESRVAAINPAQLDQQAQGDRDLILNDIRSELLSLQVIRQWQTNPDYYSTGITNSAFVIMERPYASADTRLQSLIEREKQMPAVLQAAKINLHNPPRIYTEIALEQLPGMIAFFQKDVPAAFSDVTDKMLLTSFKQSNDAVIAALQQYEQWLKKTVLPKSHGDFRLGADTFKKKLRYDEMVDMPLARLLAIGMDNMRANQRAYQQLIKELAGEKGSPVQVMKAIKSDHPAPDQLLTAFSSTFDDLITFIKTKKIITIPSDVRPVMEETPPFMRATTFASMDTPGPFEHGTKKAWFNVTLPDPSWGQAKVADYLTAFNNPAIRDVAIHEAYPGHYVQFLWVPKLPTRVRKIFGARTNIEGWAHYCEQMMLEEGYGQSGNTIEAKRIRIGQLQNALLRNARYIVAIKLHTAGMTFNQAVDFFVKEGYQSHSTGLIETKRATNDPTYLYYTLGKLQILKLRQDVKAKEGANFSLQRFHDQFMQQGTVPIIIMRRAMLGDEQGETL